MSLQHCLVLTVATGAVWMDLRTRRIANEWIITAWIAGLVTQLIRYGAAGAGIFLFGMLFPILALYILFYFHMLGAGDIKLLSAVGGFLGVPAILKCMIVSFLSGAVLSIGIILVCGNLPQRLTKFFNYFQTYFTKRKYQKKTEPVPYYDGDLMAELFTVRDDRWTDGLRRFARSLGKLIYFMDAACDLQADRKKGQYNPLLLLGIGSGAEFAPQLRLLAGDAAEEFERLPIVQDAELLQNILYSGVWTRFEAAFRPQQEEQA